MIAREPVVGGIVDTACRKETWSIGEDDEEEAEEEIRQKRRRSFHPLGGLFHMLKRLVPCERGP